MLAAFMGHMEATVTSQTDGRPIAFEEFFEAERTRLLRAGLTTQPASRARSGLRPRALARRPL